MLCPTVIGRFGPTPDVRGSSITASTFDANTSWPRSYCDEPQD